MFRVVVCCGNAVELWFIMGSWIHILQSCFRALVPCKKTKSSCFVSLTNSAVISGSQCWPTVSVQACCSQRKNRQMPFILFSFICLLLLVLLRCFLWNELWGEMQAWRTGSVTARLWRVSQSRSRRRKIKKKKKKNERKKKTIEEEEEEEEEI